MDRTLEEMVKAKLYRQNLTPKLHIHTHKKRKRGKIIYLAPKFHLLNLG